jgi:hypothetical protein
VAGGDCDIKGEEVMKYKKFLGTASTALIIVIVISLMLVPAAWAQSKFKTLHTFKGGKDGNGPLADLILDVARRTK